MVGDREPRGLITTIGYGDRPWDDFVGRLRQNDIGYLIDVRTKPTSRTPEFNRDACVLLLGRTEVRYLYLGDSLGGMPDDPRCYVDGRVDYARCEEREAFQQGLARLRNAVEGGHRIALMCSELDPERCHRSKLIGEALARQGVAITHIDRDGAQVPHEAVIARLTGGQGALFGRSFTSVGRYQPPDRELPD